MTFLNIQIFRIRGSAWDNGGERSKSLRACSKTQSFFRFTKLVEEQWDNTTRVRHRGTRLKCPRGLGWCGSQEGRVQSIWAVKKWAELHCSGCPSGLFQTHMHGHFCTFEHVCMQLLPGNGRQEEVGKREAHLLRISVPCPELRHFCRLMG